jgi:hypothetical protein
LARETSELCLKPALSHLQKYRLNVTVLQKKTSWGYRRMEAPSEGGEGPEEVVDGFKVLFETVLPPD